MALVTFVSGSASDFALLEAKDPNTLYFITDERRIYKGDTPFSGGIYNTVAEFPGTGVVNTLYVNSTTGEVAYWNGTGYQTVVPATGKTISGTGDEDHLATTKAVVDYVTAYVAAEVGDLDVGALEGRVDTLETEMDAAQASITTITGSGEGSINKALSDAKAYADSLAPNYAAADHDHVLADITDAGALAGKDNVAESDLDSALASKINGKADKASNLAGYGITDAYTKSETDSAIQTAVANADHLKREIVEDLPEVGAADENTIYMVGDGVGEGNQKYEEFMLINGAFEKIGDSAVDLTGYATETYVDQAETDAVNTAKGYTDTEVAEAVETAASDAQSKATAAETAAKSYADSKIAALDVTDAAVSGKYVSAVSEVDGKIQVTRADLPAAATLVEGTANGTVKFNGTDVAVHGLKSAAYTEASAYATAEQGLLANSALQKADIATGATNGTIKVDGSDVAVKGLGSAAYTASNAYDAAGSASTALTSAKSYTDSLLTWGSL